METASTVLCSSLKLLFTDNPTLYSILTENLFMVPNKSAFEQLMYPLLQIINKQKCTNMPPVNRITEAKFRSEVLRIIKEISVEYPALQIPSVTPTLFLTPGGEKFIDLMNKLSSLALEIKVKNMINCKPGMTMLSRPSSLKKDEVETCTKVLESLTLYHKQRFEDCRHQREKTVTDFKSNLLQVRDVQSKLHNKTEEIITAIKMVVDQFPCEPEKKRKLMELDGGAISEWAEELEKYETELDKKEQRLEAQNEQLRELYKAVQSLDSSCVTPVVLDAAEILPSSLDSEVDSRIQPLYEDSKLIMSKFLMLADESLKSVTTELSGAHIVDISNLILQLEEIAEIQMQTRQMAAYSKEKLLELQSQILGTEEEKVINGGNASGKTLEDFSYIADKVSLESPTMNGFQNEVVGKMGSSGLELPFKKSTPPFGLINRDATKVPYTADDLSMTPLTSQINNFDFNTRSNFERDMESATNLLAPSTIKKKPRKPFFSNISSTGKTMLVNMHSLVKKDLRRNLLSYNARSHSKTSEGTSFREHRSVELQSPVGSPLPEMSSFEIESPSPVKTPSPMTVDKVVKRMVSNIPSSVKKGHLADNDSDSSFTDRSLFNDGELSFLTLALRKLSLETPVHSRNMKEHFNVLSSSTNYRSISEESPPAFNLLSSDSEEENA